MTNKQEIDTMLTEVERLSEQIIKLQSEQETDPVERPARTDELRRLRRERAELHQTVVNLQIARLGGIPGGAPR